MTSCTLCEMALPNQPIFDGNACFCCHGCHAVYNILSSKNMLQNYATTAIFQQAVKSGLISNPFLLEQIRDTQKKELPDTELEKVYLEITDMWCPSCAEVIRYILMREEGVRHCVIDYATDLAAIHYAPRFISKESIYLLIQNFGYHPSSLDQEGKKVSSNLSLRFGIAAFCALNVMMFAYPLYATYFHDDPEQYGRFFAWLSFFTTLPVMTYCAWPIFKRCYSSLLVGYYGMEALIVMGVSAAFGFSCYELFKGGTKVYFDSLTVIVAFVLLGKIFEIKAKFSAKNALFRLTRSLPRRGRKRLEDGSTAFVSVKEIAKNDILVILQGEKVILDGVVIDGEGMCDESILTGESIPVTKTIGSPVLGGALLVYGWIAVRTTCTIEESTLKQILDLTQQEVGHKPAYVRAADKIVHWFVPLVIILALGTCVGLYLAEGSFSDAVLRATSVLLISCPCAIGIAAPLAESFLINRLAGMGVIVRNRGCLPLLGSETVYVFDKTGTVTEGKFRVVAGLETMSDEELSLCKTLAGHSTHPISRAVAEAIVQGILSIDSIQEYAGKGLKGVYKGESLYFGSEAFLRELGISMNPPQDGFQEDFSVVYFAIAGKVVSTIYLGDSIRQEMESMIPGLHVPAILLSGDSEKAVSSVAKRCGFSSWHSGCHPLQKKEFIDQLRAKGEIVCMVGDGINDAPALAAANIGISVFSATDVSIQVSDILLTTDRFQVIPEMRSLAIKGQKIISQNLFWAFFYNVIGIGLAMSGLLSPVFAAFAMVISSLIVLLNAKRL